MKARELRQQIRHKEDESLFQLGLQDAGELTHGIWRTFDKENLVKLSQLPTYDFYFQILEGTASLNV